jgi:hypothetical protein
MFVFFKFRFSGDLGGCSPPAQLDCAPGKNDILRAAKRGIELHKNGCELTCFIDQSRHRVADYKYD